MFRFRQSRRYRVVGPLICSLVSVVGTVAGQESTVGPLGDPARLVIRGVRSAPPQEVAQALRHDLDVAYASFPAAPLTEFKRLLVETAIVGFRHAGFPSPRATIVQQPGHLELNVEEGPRWKADGIRVMGARAIDAGKLAEDLSKEDAASASPERTPRWVRDEPAQLDEPTKLQLARRVDELLAQQGYTNAASKVEIVGDSKQGRAQLLITIEQEGAAVQMGDIELVNDKTYTREELLAYLQIPADAVLTFEACRKIEDRLEASGRFTQCTFYPAAKGAKPRLWLAEVADAPRLDVPLTEEQSALVKLAAWTDSFDQQGDELVQYFDFGGGWLELVLSPRQGFVARAGARGTLPLSSEFELAIIYSEDKIAMYSSKNSRKLEIAFVGEAYIPAAQITLLSGTEKGKESSGWNVWMAHRSRKYAESKGRPRASIGPRLSAATALSIVTNRHARCDWDGPIMTAQWDDYLLRTDSRNGRLIELRGSDREKRLIFRSEQDDRVKWITRPAEGLFERRRDEIVRATAGFENVLDRQRLISGAAEFVCRVLVKGGMASNDGSRSLCATIERLSRQGVLRPFDDYVASFMRRETKFRIPVATPPSEGPLLVHFNRKEGFQFDLRRVALDLADDLILQGSHSWLVSREAAFLTNGKADHAQARLARLFPPGETGPITALALAESLRLAGKDDEARRWAESRLAYATREGFRRDYADFVVPGCNASNYVLTIASALRGLDSADAEALFHQLRSLGWLSKSDERLARRFINVLRANSNKPIAAALSAALDDLWQSTVEQKLKDRLETLGAPAVTAERWPRVRRRRLLRR